MKAIVKMSCLLGIGLLGMVIGSQSADGAIAGTSTTKGKVTFLPNTSGDIIQPGTELPIVPDYGSKGTGPLRFEWVPDFNFGELPIIATGQITQVEFMKYKPKGASGPAFNTPHFVQITDERGNAGKWIAKVSATKFATAASDSIQHTLNGTTIQLAGKTVTNNTKSAAVVATDFTTPTVNGTSAVSISTVPASPTVLIQTAVGKVSNTSKTSFVFLNNYVATNYSTKSPQTATRNNGVLIRIPSSDAPRRAMYTSTVTWTLEDTL